MHILIDTQEGSNAPFFALLLGAYGMVYNVYWCVPFFSFDVARLLGMRYILYLSPPSFEDVQKYTKLFINPWILTNTNIH